MKYNVGDRVRIKNFDWFRNEDTNMVVVYMTKYYGEVVTIKSVHKGFYRIKEDGGQYCWIDEMFEGLVEEENKPKPKFKVGDRIYPKYHKPSNDLEIIEVIQVNGHYGYRIKNHHINITYFMWEYDMSNYILAEEEMKSEDGLLDEYEELTDRAFKGGYEKCKFDIELNGFQLPDGYIFKDENGNVINATKIVLEKKKKEYPKSYEECCRIFQYNENLKVYPPFSADIPNYDALHLFDLLEALRKLLICRDAYWKIAGEDMGLGKPWEPNWGKGACYTICCNTNQIVIGTDKFRNSILTFPTEEMRDAFYENFKEEIEICKELL